MKIKKHHTTIVLLILFFTGLIVLWWADYADVPTEQQRRAMVDRVLPELIDKRPITLTRLEIDQDYGKVTERLVFERRPEGNWQMIEPVDAAADRSLVETLVRNLQNLRKSPDAGTIEGSVEKYGLARPTATIRVFEAKSKSKAPLATLEVGKARENSLYVREAGAPGIEVVDARLLNMLHNPAPEWREKSLFTLPSFRVGAVTVTGPGRDLKAERVQGRWTLVRPVHSLAVEEKLEGVVAELTSLRVADNIKGFIADNVKDGAPYGLDTPTMTIELGPVTSLEKPQTLLVGKPIPDHTDQFYARRADQDDVVAVEIKDKDVQKLGTDVNALRSQKVADLSPGRANAIRIRASGTTIELVKSPAGWQLVKPVREAADPPSVQSLLDQLGALQTSAFLDPTSVADPKLDPPTLTLQVWQAEPGGKATIEPGTEPKGEPRVNLEIGRYDALRKVILGRVAGDRTILALPEPFLKVLPRNTLAFRDKTMLNLPPGQVHRLTIHRGGTSYVLSAPGTGSGPPTHWRMEAPVKAPADNEAATKVALLLSNLRAEEFVSDQVGDGKAYGLDAPQLTVSWTSSREANASPSPDKLSTGTLRIGSKVPKSEQSYANIEGSPIVFTLGPSSVEPFEGEFHDRHVLSFPADKVERLLIGWPGRTVSFTPEARPDAPPRWRPEPGIDLSDFDLNKLSAFVGSLSNLLTPMFVQYEGPFASSFGLDDPQLTIRLVVGGARPETKTLRIGHYRASDQVFATTEPGSSGVVFVLGGPAWIELVKSVRPSYELPDDVFAPEP